MSSKGLPSWIYLNRGMGYSATGIRRRYIAGFKTSIKAAPVLPPRPMGLKLGNGRLTHAQAKLVKSIEPDEKQRYLKPTCNPPTACVVEEGKSREYYQPF